MSNDVEKPHPISGPERVISMYPIHAWSQFVQTDRWHGKTTGLRESGLGFPDAGA